MASQKKYLTKNIKIEIDPVEGSTCAKEQRLLKESPGKKVHPGSDSIITIGFPLSSLL